MKLMRAFRGDKRAAGATVAGNALDTRPTATDAGVQWRSDEAARAKGNERQSHFAGLHTGDQAALAKCRTHCRRGVRADRVADARVRRRWPRAKTVEFDTSGTARRAEVCDATLGGGGGMVGHG